MDPAPMPIVALNGPVEPGRLTIIAMLAPGWYKETDWGAADIPEETE
jgi:hypothetical protein